jgi:hypothetical protein
MQKARRQGKMHKEIVPTGWEGTETAFRTLVLEFWAMDSV